MKTKIIAGICCLVIFGNSALADSIKGTLYKKGTTWYCFVESEDSKFKKGSIRLLDVPKEYKKFLVQKAFVKIDGQEIVSAKGLSVKVEKISLTNFDPLKSK